MESQTVSAQMFHFQNYSADERSSYRDNLICVPDSLAGPEFQPFLEWNTEFKLPALSERFLDTGDICTKRNM